MSGDPGTSDFLGKLLFDGASADTADQTAKMPKGGAAEGSPSRSGRKSASGEHRENPRSDVPFDVTLYPTPHSDAVAHLVLHHQAHAQNLLIRVHYEARMHVRSDAEDRLLRYLFFAEEPPLNGPVRGSSGFAEWFQAQGPTGGTSMSAIAKGAQTLSKVRPGCAEGDRFERNRRHDGEPLSLRNLGLETRLFKYRMSYLVYSDLFQGLPIEVKSRLYREMWRVLQGTHPAPELRHLPSHERRTVVDILRDTLDDLPDYWYVQRPTPD